MLSAIIKKATNIYRVRKTWEDAKSQVGAYKILANAKRVADSKKLNVYDSKGKLVYSGIKNTPTVQQRMTAWAKKTANEKYHYVRWNAKVPATQTCPICKGRKFDNNFGWNCIGFAWACWHHGGGLKSRCNCGVISNDIAEKILKSNAADALKLARKYIGINDIQVIRNEGKAIPVSSLKEGDIILFFKGKTYYHTAYYMGGGKYAESNTTGGIGHANNIRAGLTLSANAKANLKLAFRYVGK